MNKPLLSICIPTYNRAKYLEKCLTLMVPLLSDKRIQIVISDNNSTDETELIAAKYQQIPTNTNKYQQIPTNTNSLNM